MRFEVPQFINVQDKLFGPFTFQEALYLVGGGGLTFVLYKLLPFSFAIFFGVPVIAFTLALIFYKPNGRPFINLVEAFILYSFSKKFYLWRQKEKGEGQIQEITQVHAPILREGEIPEEEVHQKISNLAWSLDVLDFDENK